MKVEIPPPNHLNHVFPIANSLTAGHDDDDLKLKIFIRSKLSYCVREIRAT